MSQDHSTCNGGGVDELRLDVLSSRIRAAAVLFGGPDPSDRTGSLTETLVSLDTSILREIDAAIYAQAMPRSAPTGRLKLVKKVMRRLMKMAVSDIMQANVSIVSGLVGVNDKTTATALEVDRLRQELSELHTRVAQLESLLVDQAR